MRKIFLFVAGLLCFSSGFAAEQIERFDSVAQVKKDSSVLVTETITVRAAGGKIRRGIFRVLPYKGVSSYEVRSVLRDGKAEPYHVKKSSSGETVYIGDKSVVLSPGRYTYQLSYAVKGAVRFQREFDEFYWNVTGNDWQFPIQSASFQLALPEGAEIVPGGISFYTGFAGEKGRAAHMLRELVVATTRPLKRGEGLTVSAAWNKRGRAGTLPAPKNPGQKEFRFGLFSVAFAAGVLCLCLAAGRQRSRGARGKAFYAAGGVISRAGALFVQYGERRPDAFHYHHVACFKRLRADK